MSILNVNQIQPVGSGQTVTISAANLDITGNLKGVTSSGISTFSSGIDITGGQLRIGTTSGDGTLRVFGDSGRVIIGDTSVNYYDADTHIFRNYAAAQKVTINSSGNIVLAGSGQGIDFSANSNAAGMTSELLDDYEVGTFTPVITAVASNPTVTYTSQAGRYVKVGRMVHIQVDVRWSALSGGGGNVNINLPFTSNSNYSGGIVAEKSGANLSASGNILTLETNGSQDSIVFLETKQTGSSSGYSVTSLGSVGYLIFSFVYGSSS